LPWLDVGLADRLQGHQHEVHNLAFMPGGKTLVSSGLDGSIRFWDVSASPRRPARITLPIPMRRYAPCFSPDGKELYTANKDGAIAIWDVASAQEKQRLFLEAQPKTHQKAGFSSAAQQNHPFW
jgi:WD40 repeat protein